MAQIKTVEIQTLKKVKQDTTSKGTQSKWYDELFWYKADTLGYEGLSEVIISRLLKDMQINSIIYESVYLSDGLKTIKGCYSKNFKNSNEVLVSAERLHRLENGVGLAQYLGQLSDVTTRIKYTVDFLESITNIKNIGNYITRILEIDALFLNEDRHTNNIAVIYNTQTKEYKLAPIFDNGLALLSDEISYMYTNDVYTLIGSVGAKPFSTDFDEQLDCAETLYGIQNKYTFNKQEVKDILYTELKDMYGDTICQRVLNVLYAQMQKYQYLF